ncbi:enoyl-CoA hydratase/isomerase family protein [Streptomyces antimycoticus]|uniref:enoyl-CoA hydratase/isomerase family protein n=1 Tax=Streptomyces antimycoticus TaxID=68175 RepID=UPI002570A769|nr:enoyl-CoA hydratase/isomerase family protein [Streptomyces antimycoticus]WJD96338.1 enoyl-CoA hydratase/isomerase family protein [Streptomyces antimycoticus]
MSMRQKDSSSADKAREVLEIPGLAVSWPEAGVALVEFDRPHRRNALDRPLLDGLPVLLRQLNRRDDVRVIVLSGRGGSFCAGGDLAVIGDMQGESPSQAADRMAREFESTAQLLDSRKITVAAVEGPAVGAGLALALACDIRVGGATAVFAAPFIKMALVPDFGVSWLLARTAGASAALDITLTGRKVFSEEALSRGLLTEIAAHPLPHALAKAEVFADAEPTVAAATKQLIRSSLSKDFASTLRAEIAHQLDAISSAAFHEHWSAWAAAVRSA